VLRPALLLSIASLTLSPSGNAQTQADSAAAVRAIHASLTNWVAAANRGDWKSALKLAVVRDIWRFTTAAGKPDAATSVVRGFEVWTEQPDSSWRISRWISAPEPPAH